MDLSSILSLINVILALTGAIGVFRLAGNWRKVVQQEEQDLRKKNFSKAACDLRIRLSFTKASKKIDDWCGIMGVGVVVLLTLAVLFTGIVLVSKQVLSSAPGGSLTLKTAPSATSSQPAGGPKAPSQVVGNQKSISPVESSSFFLFGVNSVLFLLIILILVGVGQLKIMGSILQEAREFYW